MQTSKSDLKGVLLKLLTPKNRSRKRIHIVVALNFGGSEKVLLNIANGYMRACKVDEIQFWSLSHGGQVAEKLRDLGFEVLIFNESPKIPNLKLLFALTRRIRAVHPLEVITHGAEANFHGVIAAKINRTPVVLTEEIGIPNHSKKAQIVFRHINRLADCALATSIEVAEYLISTKEASAQKILISFVPVETMHQEKSNFDIHNFCNFIFLGRFEPIKNIELIIKACAFLKEDLLEENWCLHFYGNGSEKEKMLSWIEECRLTDHLFVEGQIANIESVLYESNFLIQASDSEGFGLSMVEAMQCGTPVITTAVGLARELIHNGVTGYLLEETTVFALANSMMQAMHMSRTEYYSMSTAAKKISRNRFSTAVYLDRLNSRIETISLKKQ